MTLKQVLLEERRHIAVMSDIVGYTAVVGRNWRAAYQILARNKKMQLTLLEKCQGTLIRNGRRHLGQLPSGI